MLFRRYDRAPEREQGDRIVQSWDTASKANPTNDYSVCTTWLMRRRDYYLLGVQRVRLEFPALRRLIKAEQKRWDARAVLIEDAGSGMALIQDLRDNSSLRPIPVKPDANLDPAYFEEPLKPDLTRRYNPHVAFAVGTHHCLGSHLARNELRVAVDQLHRRIPEYHVPDGEEIQYEHASVRQARYLPVEFSGK
jgi:hypothetical protein